MSPLWRNRLIAAAVVIVALAASFSAGRFSAPLKVETRDVEKVVYRDRVVTVEKAAKVETRIVWRDRVTTKDGTVTEREIEKSGATTTTARDTDSTHASDAARDTRTLTTSRPDWRVGILAGAALQQPLLPIAGPLTLGVIAERRIIGGVWLGAWTLPQHGAVGASLSLEF